MNSRYTDLLTDIKVPRDNTRDPETSSEASFTSSVSNLRVKRPCRITQSNPELSKEIIDNIPIFDRKAKELNQFINTIESCSNLY